MTARGSTISCNEAVRQLWDYLDQGLTPEESANVEEHLSFCRRCCGEMEFAKELQSFLLSSGVEEIPPRVRERLERLLDQL